jgi:hypothetical protein
VSGVRPALASRWRAALEAAFGPSTPRRTSNRMDDTIRTRAVATGHREALAIAFLALVMTALALWMWTRGTPAPSPMTRTPKDSAATVKGTAASPPK